MTDDDALLRLPFHEDNRADADVPVRLLELFDNNFHTIRYFLIIIEEYLFADDFGDEEAGRLVSPLVFVEIGWRLGQEFLYAALRISPREPGLHSKKAPYKAGRGRVPASDY